MGSVTTSSDGKKTEIGVRRGVGRFLADVGCTTDQKECKNSQSYSESSWFGFGKKESNTTRYSSNAPPKQDSTMGPEQTPRVEPTKDRWRDITKSEFEQAAKEPKLYNPSEQPVERLEQLQHLPG